MPRPEMPLYKLKALEAKADMVMDANKLLNPVLVTMCGSDEGRKVVMEMFMAGVWLFDELRALGLTQDECEMVGFAHGSECAKPGVDPWEIANLQIDKWKKGEFQKAKSTLAQRRREVFEKYAKFSE